MNKTKKLFLQYVEELNTKINDLDEEELELISTSIENAIENDNDSDFKNFIESNESLLDFIEQQEFFDEDKLFEELPSIKEKMFQFIKQLSYEVCSKMEQEGIPIDEEEFQDGIGMVKELVIEFFPVFGKEEATNAEVLASLCLGLYLIREARRYYYNSLNSGLIRKMSEVDVVSY